MTLVVASLVEGSIQEASASSRAAFAAGADLVELRLDHLKEFDVHTARKARREILGPTIATLRSKAQGGKSPLTGEKRAEAIKEILDSDFEYVDVELESDRALVKKWKGSRETGTKTIISSHLQRPVSRTVIEKKLAESFALGDIAKVAMHCEDASQALELAQLGLRLARQRKAYAIIGMGIPGQLTRVFADKMGSSLVYACVAGKPAAPGQLNVAAQVRILQEERTVLGLIGHPVSHSVSKPMQEAALEGAGLTGVYLPLDIPPKNFDGNTLRIMKTLGFRGVNVTIPHKSKAFKLSDQRGDAAEATRAVNTVRFAGTKVIGENTDVFGFAKLIEGKTTITRNTNALIIGAGGASRAVAYVLSERQALLTIIDVEHQRAVELARTFGGKAISVRRLWNSDISFDLVVNCTPIGMKGMAGSPLKASFVRPGSVYIDIVYNPPSTKAMEIASGRGARAFGGLEMLVQQGAESFRIWTGREPNVETMREAAGRALQ